MSEEKKNEILEQEKELDKDELDKVAGGDNCGCFLGGGGLGDSSYSMDCVCVGGGGGEYWDGSCRCACPAVGAGVDY